MPNLSPSGAIKEQHLSHVVQEHLSPEAMEAAAALWENYEALDVELITNLRDVGADLLAALPVIDEHKDGLHQLTGTLISDLRSHFHQDPKGALRLRFTGQGSQNSMKRFLSATAARLIVMPVKKEDNPSTTIQDPSNILYDDGILNEQALALVAEALTIGDIESFTDSRERHNLINSSETEDYYKILQQSIIALNQAAADAFLSAEAGIAISGILNSMNSVIKIISQYKTHNTEKKASTYANENIIPLATEPGSRLAQQAKNLENTISAQLNNTSLSEAMRLTLRKTFHELHKTKFSQSARKPLLVIHAMIPRHNNARLGFRNALHQITKPVQRKTALTHRILKTGVPLAHRSITARTVGLRPTDRYAPLRATVHSKRIIAQSIATTPRPIGTTQTRNITAPTNKTPPATVTTAKNEKRPVSTPTNNMAPKNSQPLISGLIIPTVQEKQRPLNEPTPAETIKTKTTISSVKPSEPILKKPSEAKNQSTQNVKKTSQNPRNQEDVSIAAKEKITSPNADKAAKKETEYPVDPKVEKTEMQDEAAPPPDTGKTSPHQETQDDVSEEPTGNRSSPSQDQPDVPRADQDEIPPPPDGDEPPPPPDGDEALETYFDIEDTDDPTDDSHREPDPPLPPIEVPHEIIYEEVESTKEYHDACQNIMDGNDYHDHGDGIFHSHANEATNQDKAQKNDTKPKKVTTKSKTTTFSQSARPRAMPS